MTPALIFTDTKGTGCPAQNQQLFWEVGGKRAIGSSFPRDEGQQGAETHPGRGRCLFLIGSISVKNWVWTSRELQALERRTHAREPYREKSPRHCCVSFPNMLTRRRSMMNVALRRMMCHARTKF